MNNIIERIVVCENKKDLVNSITDYIQDTVVYVAVLKHNKKWGYIVLEFNEDESEEFVKELEKIDNIAVVMQGYEMGSTSKLSISRHITYFRNMYKQDIEEKQSEKQSKEIIINNLEVKEKKDKTINNSMNNYEKLKMNFFGFTQKRIDYINKKYEYFWNIDYIVQDLFYNEKITGIIDITRCEVNTRFSMGRGYTDYPVRKTMKVEIINGKWCSFMKNGRKTKYKNIKKIKGVN